MLKTVEGAGSRASFIRLDPTFTLVVSEALEAIMAKAGKSRSSRPGSTEVCPNQAVEARFNWNQ